MSRLGRRLAWCVVVVWVVVSMVFALNILLPGDPARMVAGPQARPASVERIRAQLGLDRAPLVQYALFWRRLVHVGPRSFESDGEGAHASCAVLVPLGATALHLDLGKSFQLRLPVVEIIAERVPRTFALAVAGVFFQLLFGVTTGVAAALHRGARLDRWLVGTSLLGISAPTFLIAWMLQTLFSRELRLLPLDGFGTTPGDHVRCIVLPALTLGVYGAAYYTRLVREEMSTLLLEDWVRTAKAKGLPVWSVVTRHALRNALVPLTTAVGLDFGALMGGAVVTETIFRWPGIGELSVKAMLNRDGPVICACVVVTSIAIVATQLLVDVACARLDPRVSARRASGTR